MSHTSDFIDYNDDKCFSNDELYLLSNVAVEEINNTNIKKEKDRTSSFLYERTSGLHYYTMQQAILHLESI